MTIQSGFYRPWRFIGKMCSPENERLCHLDLSFASGTLCSMNPANIKTCVLPVHFAWKQLKHWQVTHDQKPPMVPLCRAALFGMCAHSVCMAVHEWHIFPVLYYTPNCVSRARTEPAGTIGERIQPDRNGGLRTHQTLCMGTKKLNRHISQLPCVLCVLVLRLVVPRVHQFSVTNCSMLQPQPAKIPMIRPSSIMTPARCCSSGCCTSGGTGSKLWTSLNLHLRNDIMESSSKQRTDKKIAATSEVVTVVRNVFFPAEILFSEVWNRLNI